MAKVTERGGHYLLRWTDPNGERKCKTLGRVGVLPKRDVQTILRAKELELSTGRRLLADDTPRTPTFGAFAREYLAWRQTRFPDSQYRVEQIVEQHLVPAFEFEALDQIKPARVERYLSDRLREVKAGTVAKELRTLKAILHRAQRTKVLHDDPLSAVEAPQVRESKPHEFFTAEELQRIYAASVNKAAIWKLMANTGLRRSEALALKWENVQQGSLHVLSTTDSRTKSGKWRDIPLSEGARKALEALREANKGDAYVDACVLPRITPEGLSHGFAKDAKRAGIGGNIHMLRHTYISHLVQAGVPMRLVQLWAGHAHISTTTRYAHHDKSNIPDAVKELAL